MTSTSSDKILQFNGKDWGQFRMKIGAKIRPNKIEWVLKMASKNSDAIRDKGNQEMTAYCTTEEDVLIVGGEEEEAEDAPRRYRTIRTLDETKFREAQIAVHTMLVMACVDSCYKVIAGVDEEALDCGSQIWDKLLRRYEPTMGISRVRLTLDTLDTCGRFKQMLDDG